MGTRHLICVFYNGKFCLAQYGNCDGYPGGQGVTIVKFLRRPENIQRLKDGLKHTYEVPDETALAAKRKIDMLRGLERVAWLAYLQSDDPLITSQITEFLQPSLHGDTGAGILEVIAQAQDEEDKVPIQLNLPFANNWLMCKWAYVVDLDEGVLEVFRGAEQKASGHRFQDVGECSATVPSLISTFSFSELQEMKDEQEFLDRLDSAGHKEGVAVSITRPRCD
ncbi:hypothetical protein VTI74DRAFT_5264 [Chaetomium olivicolor]